VQCLQEIEPRARQVTRSREKDHRSRVAADDGRAARGVDRLERRGRVKRNLLTVTK
jgi:hypothetical protein